MAVRTPLCYETSVPRICFRLNKRPKKHDNRKQNTPDLRCILRVCTFLKSCCGFLVVPLS